MGELVTLVHVDLALDRQVTALTERGQVVPCEVVLHTVEMMDGEDAPVLDLRVVRAALVAQEPMAAQP